MAIACLKPGSNSARPPPGGGSNAYKADTRKPKGLLVIGSLSLRFAESSLLRSQIDVNN